jgi:alkylation response protein AidB-like acyl-CoA dehydrogenase
MLTQGAIDLLLHHGTEEQREVFLPKLVTGEWAGTMCLTEPHAGSDVGALTTRAERRDDGTYRITGTKIFITYGEHDMADNIVHLVLARTPDAPPGTKGISCFLVPKHLIGDDGTLGDRNDVTCVGIEHKLGIKASPTCTLAFGEGEGAVGHLVGEENQGMRYMFTMMNNARLGVAAHGLAIGERAFQDALDYAQERRQGRAPGAPKGEMSPIAEHPDVRRMLLWMKSHVEAMRAIIYGNAFQLDMSRHHPDPDLREAERDLVDLLTPIAKAWCTDVGVEVASTAVQVHGGMGFIEETGVAQHYRDVRIAPIYEGTNGIQAMDLIGRKLGLKGGKVVEDFLTMVAALDPVLAKAGEPLAGVRAALAEAVTTLADTTNWIVRHGTADPRDALAGATPYLRMFSLVTAGWYMAKQALAARRLLDAGEGDPAFLEAKVTTARFFCEQVLPQVQGLVGAVEAGHGPLYEIEDLTAIAP